MIIIECLTKLLLMVCLLDCLNCLRVRTPSIFGRRMKQIDSSLRSALEYNDVVFDVIDTFPTNKVQVRYPSGVEVDLGNELTPKSVKDEPTVKWPIEVGQHYTLVMIDPDVPTRKEPTEGQIKHWLVINIPGTLVEKGETLAVYRGSRPPSGSGLHRYIFLVYRQNGPIIHSEKVISTSAREGRTKFRVRDFAKKYNLGDPVAANFYVAQYDDYVELMKAESQQKIRSESQVKTIRADPQDYERKPMKKSKFPQMICMKYGRYLEILNMLNNTKKQ